MTQSLMNWTPFRQLRRDMRDEIDRFFEDSLSTWPQMLGAMRAPAVNLSETDQAVILEVAVPGLKEQDICIEAKEDSVTIWCEKQAKQEDNHNGYYRREFSHGAFSRTLSLPVAVKSEEAKAALKDGLLTITLPKLEPSETKAVQVPISSH